MGNCKDHQPSLVQLQGRGNAGGKEYWRSLEELAGTPEFQKFIEREFPSQASEFNDPAGRRNFLKVMGASLALAGVGGAACTVQPTETIVPYIEQPEELVPGKALFFATAMQLGGSAIGLLAKSNEGRPTKLEGNPEHPASLGATDVFAQAAILDLYDPDRSTTLTYRNEIRPWTAFVSDVRGIVTNLTPSGGAGVRLLTETVTSPTLGAQIKTFLQQFPAAKWHQYEPAGFNSAVVGANLAFGQPLNAVYRFDRAERVLSLGSDFLSCGSGSVRYARDFAAKRRVDANRSEMNRLYVVESTLTNTGALADHRLALRPSEMQTFVRELATALGAAGSSPEAPASSSLNARWIDAVVKDLQQFRGASLVIAGEEQPPVIHALAHAMNAALGNAGNTVIYTDPLDATPVDQMQSLRALVQDINNGAVQFLMIIGGNPVYNAPVDLNFVEALKKVEMRAHLSLHKNETSEWCQWQIPEAHFLEAWSDTRAFDGTVTIMQPLIEPLYGGKSAHEVIAVFANQNRRGYEMVREYWQGQMGGDFERMWRRAVHDGVVADTAFQPKTVAVRGDFAAQTAMTQPAVASSASSLEILFRQDPTVYDGRFANNGWLQRIAEAAFEINMG
ncbi:MAG: TAT-variant-translocated molybdopterin oxidoreductase [Pyrinomonadaceae bacterium]